MPLKFSIKWRDAGKEAECAPNPAFPEGMDLDVSKGAADTCAASLPYPARRIGAYEIRCNHCGFTAVCTTAGRPDDPRSIKFPCQRTASTPTH